MPPPSTLQLSPAMFCMGLSLHSCPGQPAPALHPHPPCAYQRDHPVPSPSSTYSSTGGCSSLQAGRMGGKWLGTRAPRVGAQLQLPLCLARHVSMAASACYLLPRVVQQGQEEEEDPLDMVRAKQYPGGISLTESSRSSGISLAESYVLWLGPGQCHQWAWAGSVA